MRQSRIAALLAGALLALALVARPIAHGVPLRTVLAFWATLLGQVVLPGMLVVRGARLLGSRDGLLLVGQGACVGLSLQAVATFLGRCLSAPWLATAVAVAAAGMGFALARRGASAADTAGAPPPATATPILLVALVAVSLQPLASAHRLGEPIPFDLLFHAGTAGELRHRWPLEDPRVAGVPLHYHVLGYALPIEAADLAGAPLADTLLALAPLCFVALLALQAANAGRVVFRDARAGVLGAAFVLFHADPGSWLGLGAFAFNSHFATAVYGSPTTAVSLLLLLGLTLSLHGWLETHSWRELAVAALLAAAVSGAKTTVVPVVACALALCGALSLVRRRGGDWRAWAAAAATVAVAGAPFTLWQTLGPSSYSKMAHFGALTAFTSSGFAKLAAAWAGADALAGVSVLPLLVLWLVGFLGAAGVATAFWLARRSDPLTRVQSWMLALFATALVASLLVDAPGLSQLFLLYNGQLLLGLFAGAGLARALAPRQRLADYAAGLLLLLAALPTIAMVARALPAVAASDIRSAGHVSSTVADEYARGLAWLRRHASREAVVFADNPSLLLTAMGELRLYYETGLYTARAWEVGPGREPWPERAALQERLLRRPDRSAIAEARRAIGSRDRLLIVADSVQSRVESGFVLATVGPVPGKRLFPEELFELRFANAALHVYEARPDHSRGRSGLPSE